MCNLCLHVERMCSHFCHLEFELRIARSFCWKAVWTDVKFLDGFFLNNPNRFSVIRTPLDRCTWPVVSAYAAWHQMVPVCLERWCTEANEATQTHCYNPVAPAYSVWAYYAHGRQRRCQEDPVSLPSGGLEKTTRSSPHHVAQHCPTGSETTPPYAPWSRRFGSWRTALCGGWCRRMALRNLRVVCQKRRRRPSLLGK